MSIVEELSTELQNISSVKILDSTQASAKYGVTTYSPSIPLDGAIIVTEESAIGNCLKAANKLKLFLNPISTNKNWGYGSFSEQSTKPNFILDLNPLKKIIPTDKELGLITIGTGVTQQELYTYLKKNNWKYMVPVTGAGPYCSIVSNAIERGYGITPHNDHFYASTALKAYIPHPELCEQPFESAVSALDKSGDDFVDKSYKWGLGPYIDGIFTQSNLAIITEMTVRLAPIPKHFCSFYLKIDAEENFLATVDFIKSVLKDYAGMVASVNLMDTRRLISITAENPNLFQDKKILTDTQISNIANNKRLPKWMVVGSIYSEKELIGPLKRALKKRSRHLGKLIFSDSKRIKLLKSIIEKSPLKIDFLNNINTQLNSLKESTDIMLGIPNQVALPLPYWRNPRVRPNKEKPLSPSSDQCGLLWYAPLIKMKAQSLKEFTQFVRNITPKYDIDPLITFTNLKHDCVDATIPIVFNLADKLEVKRAQECLDELVKEGSKKGYVPYRLNVNQQEKLDKKHAFWKTAAKLKEALDPNNIITPGRYDPR